MLKKLAGQNERISEGEIGSGRVPEEMVYNHSESNREFHRQGIMC